jgi:ribosomal protein S18 acetylase RimI-like enzyme
VIRLRTATPEDLPGLAAVFIAAWQAGYRGVVPDEILDALEPAAVLAELRANAAEGTTTVAVSDAGQVVGFARFGTDDDEGYLASLYVDPAAAGAGLGRRLLDHALGQLPGRDVTLWVFAGNARARRLYERAGFRPDGRQLTDPRWAAVQVGYRRSARPE